MLLTPPPAPPSLLVMVFAPPHAPAITPHREPAGPQQDAPSLVTSPRDPRLLRRRQAPSSRRASHRRLVWRFLPSPRAPSPRDAAMDSDKQHRTQVGVTLLAAVPRHAQPSPAQPCPATAHTPLRVTHYRTSACLAATRTSHGRLPPPPAWHTSSLATSPASCRCGSRHPHRRPQPPRHRYHRWRFLKRHSCRRGP